MKKEEKKKFHLDKKTKLYLILLLIVCISLVAFVSFAYYTAKSSGNNQKISINNGNIVLEYTDCSTNRSSDCSNITGNLEPGDTISKSFKVKNVGTLTGNYNILFSTYNSTFVNDELTYTLTKNDGSQVASGTMPYGDKTNYSIASESIKPNETNEYYLIVSLKNSSSGNNESNKSATFTAKLGIASVN